MYRILSALVMGAALAAPAQAQIDATHDDCSTAFAAVDGVYTFDTTGATSSGVLASGLPAWIEGIANTACEDFNGAPDDLHLDVWIAFTAQSTSEYTISTCNTSSYDSKMAIYSGVCGTQVARACNDDGVTCLNFTSELVVDGLAAGQTYLVQLGSFSALDMGTGTIDMNPTAPPPPGPANDDCAAAELISGDGSFPFDSTSAQTSGLVNHPLCDPGGFDGLVYNEIWFAWTAPVSGNATVSITTPMDSKLAIFDGGSCATSTLVDCDDVITPGGGEIVGAPVLAGNTYLIAIGGWQAGETGSGDMVIATTPAGPGVVFCSANPNEATSLGGTTGALIYSSGTASVADNDLVLAAGPIRPNEPAILFYGESQVNGGAGLAFGDGLRCAGGSTVRFFPPIFSDAAGVLIQPLDNTAGFVSGASIPVISGATRHFQFWYRSPNGPFGNGGLSGFNLSDGLAVTFLP